MLFIPLLLLSLSLPCWAQTDVRNFVFFSNPICQLPPTITSLINDPVNNDVNAQTNATSTLFSVGGQLQDENASTTNCGALYDDITATQRALSISNNDYATIRLLERSPPNYAAFASAYRTFEIPENSMFNTCGDYNLTVNNGTVRVIVLASLNAARRTAECFVAEYLQNQLEAADNDAQLVVIIGSDPPTLDPVACAEANASDMSCSYNRASAEMNAAYAVVIRRFSNIILFQAFGGVPTFSYAVPPLMDVPMLLIPSLQPPLPNSGGGTAPNAAYLRVEVDESTDALVGIIIRYFLSDSFGAVIDNSGMDLNVTTRLGIPDLSLESLRNATLRLYNNETIDGETQAAIWNEVVGAGNSTCFLCDLADEATRRRYACSMVYTLFDAWNGCRNGTMPLTPTLLFPGTVLIRGTVTIDDASDSSFDFAPFVGGGAEFPVAARSLQDDLASSLSVSSPNIVITSIRLGSMIVNFEVFFRDEEIAGMSLEQLNATAQALQQRANNLSSTSFPTLETFIQVTNSSFSPNVTLSNVEVDSQLEPIAPINPGNESVPNPDLNATEDGSGFESTDDPNLTTGDGTGNSNESVSTTGLSPGAIVAITIGSSVFVMGMLLLIIAAIAVFQFRSKGIAARKHYSGRNQPDNEPHDTFDDANEQQDEHQVEDQQERESV